MGSEIWGGGLLLLLAALAYDNDERPGVLADPILVAGLAVLGPATQLPSCQADVLLSGHLSLRKRSLPRSMLGMLVATSSGTVGTPSMMVMRWREKSFWAILSSKGAYEGSWETPRRICLQL